MKRSAGLVAGTLLAATCWLTAASASAAPLRAFQLASESVSDASPAQDFHVSGLTVGRIFDSSSHNIINFNRPGSASAASLTEMSVNLPLSDETIAPRVFAESEKGVQLGATTEAIGMQLDLLSGAQASAALVSSSPSFGGTAFAPSSGTGPAVFAFYNFPQPQERIGLGEAFGLRAPDAALAATLSQAPEAGPSAMSVSSSPLVSSLSSQGPFWYSAYSPAVRGSSLTLSVPFRVAKIPVRLRLGEQQAAEVQSASLATQILGPALASSAAGKYNAVSGGVTVALPLLSRRATVSLDGLYESLQRGDKSPFELVPYASQALPFAVAAPGAVVYTPAIGDVQQYTGRASVALPVTSRLTVNGSFSKVVSGGVALDTLTQSLSQRKIAFGGGVAYNFPKTNSSIEFFSNKNVYTDDNVPSYQFTENRQNLYFSVKF